MLNVFGRRKSVATCWDWIFSWESEMGGHGKTAIIRMRKRGIFMYLGMIVFLERLIFMFCLKVIESAHTEINRLTPTDLHYHIEEKIGDQVQSKSVR
jgi:hypothetical protein